MGDKATARDTMKNVGVPTVPGSDGVLQSTEEGIRLADEIGSPVMIKATAGGGGRGMRLAKERDEFVKLLQSEAAAAFGNDGVYSEKCILNPRHIEFQEQMKNYKPTKDYNATIDPFWVVMNKENYGYRRLFGRGVTNTLVKKVDGACTLYMIPKGLVESFKANVEVEKNHLLEMRKEIEEDHERKKAELEAMQKDIANQRQNLESMMQKVMKRLPVGDRDE
ncbi:putative ligase [Helianthus debilis subsp. tardiflorus]